MYFPAAFRLILILISIVLLFFLPAAAGVAGAPFGRASAD
jgi:hypothetical protein